MLPLGLNLHRQKLPPKVGRGACRSMITTPRWKCPGRALCHQPGGSWMGAQGCPDKPGRSIAFRWEVWARQLPAQTGRPVGP